MKNLTNHVLLPISVLFTLSAPVSFSAQELSHDELLKNVQLNRQNDSLENQKRLREFENRRDKQAELLREAKAALRKQEGITDQLDATLKKNELELAALDEKFKRDLGNFGELFGVARQVAGDTRAQVEGSLISAEFPDREHDLNAVAKSKELPTIMQLRKIWAVLLQEQTEQGKVSSFSATVNDENGHPQTRQVIRIGPFTAVSDGKYLNYSSESSQLIELQRQPGSAFLKAAGELENAAPGTLVNAAIDPSSGAILGLLVQTPRLVERIEQGGLVGYVVIALALIGLLIGFERLISLWITSVRVKRQTNNKEPNKKNPLGRVLTAYTENSFADVETLELKLDDAILREVPKLERGLGAIKVLAGVAPLLGLLGTVTGMILTFQSITLWGTGDPKLMAGGISQALMTTVLGLVAAIPLLLLHSMANGRAKLIQQILEEQSAGLVAEQAERH